LSRIVCQPNLNLEDANLQDRTNRLLRRPITPHIEIPFHSMAYYASLRRNTMELIHQESINRQLWIYCNWYHQCGV